jgi:hypothetical protein
MSDSWITYNIYKRNINRHIDTFHSTITIYSTPTTIYNTLPSISGIQGYTVAVLDRTWDSIFSFLMHLCDMQGNCISMESAKCAQSNKTCRQSEIWYLFDKIRVKGQIVTFTVFAMHYHLSFLETFKNIMSWKIFFSQQILSLSEDLYQDLICVTFHDIILLSDLWNYGSGKHWLSFQIISAICMIYMHFVTSKCVRVSVEQIRNK